ncbi:tryptophan halogenase family protein [Asticcacaulis sp.]|uniref:tryptophan halogenase family protein n=1 Tax=Asticcacaulis sp. TaxID=1872648 RepID=UPI003F7B3E0F
MTNSIKSITIVGGGTAGWMTAALLSKLLMGRYDITLIESEEIGTIGVGEATIPAIKVFNEMLEVNEAEFLKATQGTFKLGIEFVGWRDGPHDPTDSYIHGFGKIGIDRLWLHTHQFWLKMREKGMVKHFDHYAICCAAARKGRFTSPDPRRGPPISDLDYAYHFDASLYARYLRTLSEGRGVKRVEGKITNVTLRPEDGFIDTVTLQNGQSVGGDLFIDCSGMRGLLIGEALGVGYEDWNAWLLCDRAYAVPSVNPARITPYVTCTTRDAGWQWRIPLQHRTGNGYVHSSGYTDDHAAVDTLMRTLGGQPLAEPRLVKFRPGKRHKSWEKNCVAIGLSGGFLEPLESTSIHLIQTGILRLLSLFPGQGFNAADIDAYNTYADDEYRDIRDFIIAHYKVSNREDTPFWAYVRHMPVPDSLQSKLDLFRSSARVFKRGAFELFREESWVQVLLGQGMAAGYDPNVDLLSEAEIIGFLRDIEAVIDGNVNAMPRHEDYITRYCQAPKL